MNEATLEMVDKSNLETSLTEPGIWFIADMLSDAGICRKVNQDACCVRTMKIEDHILVMAAVCDGVGGFQEGDYASRSTVQSLNDWFDYTVSKNIRGKSQKELMDYLQAETEQRIRNQNSMIYKYAMEKKIRIGTTLTLLVIVNYEYYTAQVGDSRAYHIRDGLTQLTEDQSLVAQEIKAGRLSAEEARHDKRRNIILQCIGGAEDLHIVYRKGEVCKEDVFFLCSDGFIHELGEGEIEKLFDPKLLQDRVSVKERIRNAISLVKERGEKDNITVVLVKVQEKL
ncbi:MAG: serine/threonine-protein phosphatase [Lachnospiraceae bacterium]|nr:serine/threonine-protein phosphatase [Lachnospiraceae bacterium]